MDEVRKANTSIILIYSSLLGFKMTSLAPALWSSPSLLCPCRVIVSYFSLMVIKGTLCFIKPPYIGIFKEI